MAPRVGGGSTSPWSPRSMSSSSVGAPDRVVCVQATYRRRPPAAAARTWANSASWTIARGSSAAQTAASCGAEKAVCSSSAWAPSFEAAVSASTKPRWLRQRIATVSPAAIPSALQAWASAFVRRCSSAKVSSPWSSMIAVASG